VVLYYYFFFVVFLLDLADFFMPLPQDLPQAITLTSL